MSWPLSQDYNEAIQSPATNFTDADLKKGEAATNALGIPMPYSGNFADVYQVRCPDGSRWAVKCFTREAPGLRERYQEISSWLRKAKLPFTVDFSYLEQGIRIAGKWHPILKMQWVEGLTLNQFVAQYLDKPAMLEALLQLWAKMGKYLRAAQVGHCDLQHGNVLLVPGSTPNALALKLIDYDGMWIPSLAKTKSGEVGHANFQHPRRLREGTYSLEVDRFPLLLVATAMRALKADKSLWAKYDNGDNLLFKESDLVAPGQSALFEELASLPDPGLVMLAAQVRAALKGSLESAALLEDVMPEAKAPTSSARPSRLVAGPPSGAGFTKTAPMAAPVVAPPPKTEKTFAFDEAGPHSTRIKRKPATKKAAGMPVGLLVAAAVGVIVVIGGAAGAFFLTRGSPKDKPPAKPPAELAVVQSRQIDDSDKEAVKPVGDHGLKPDKSNSEKPVDDGPGPEPAVKPNEEVDADPKGPIGEVRQFEGHTGEIRGLAVSPDGKQLLTASFDKTVRLWDVATGRELQRCEGHTEKVHGVVFLPDGVRALSASDDKTVRLWNLKDGHEIRSFSGHAQPAYMVAVTRDGQIAASCGREDAVFLWNVETGKEVRRLEGNEKGGTESLAFSPDGKLLATGAMQGLIRLWNVETGTEVRRFTGHAGLVYRLAFSSDGRLALSCGLDKTARLWNVEDGREVRRFDQNMGVLYGAAISSNGQRVLTGGVDAEVRLWDAATAKELYRFQRQPGQIRTVAFSPDGRYGFSAGTDKLARMWRLSPADKTAVVKAADQPSAALPFDSGWDKQVDPDGDCKFLAGKNTLTIELPGKDHDLGAERGVMNSPRLLRDVEGDFTVQVRVSGDFRPVGPSTAAGHIPFVGAGLVLMIDDRTYLRVERAAAVFASAGKASPYANMEWRIDGKLRPINGATPPIPEDGPAYLRLQRRSSQLLASNSQDGVKWNALPSMGVPLPPIVKVGLTAGTSSAAPFRPLYDAFKLTADKAGVAVRPAAAEKDLRKPPTSDDLVKARDAVKQEYKADYDKLNTPKDKSDLADKLRTEAFAAKDKPDRQYALLIEARDLAARGEDLAASQRIIDETAMTFAIDPKEAKEAALLTAGATFSTKAAAKAYLAEAAPLLRQARADDDYDRVAPLLPAVRKASTEAHDADMAKTAASLEKLQKEYEAVKKDLQTLKDKPDDAEANLAAGKFYSFQKQDWDKGDPYLVKSGNLALATAATKDVDAPTDASEQASLADAWMKLANNAALGSRLGTQRRAYDWYSKALPNLSDKEEERVKAQVMELTKQFPDVLAAWENLDVSKVEAVGNTYLRMKTGQMLSTKQPVDGGIEIVLVARTAKAPPSFEFLKGKEPIVAWQVGYTGVTGRRVGKSRSGIGTWGNTNFKFSPNVWVTYTCKLQDAKMDCLVDGKPYFFDVNKNDLSKPRTIQLLAGDQTLEVKSFTVNPLDKP